MAKINLLPWRESQRIERAKQFNIMAISALVVAALLVGAMYAVVSAQVAAQQSRNNYLQTEINGFKKLQAQMKKLKEEEKQLLNRMNVIEDLQFSRPLAVYLMDSMARLVPDDIRLTSIEQESQELQIKGIAGSALSISDFMRRIDNSERFSKPELITIKGASQGTSIVVQFQLSAKQLIPKPKEHEKDKKGKKGRRG